MQHHNRIKHFKNTCIYKKVYNKNNKTDYDCYENNEYKFRFIYVRGETPLLTLADAVYRR